jgi:hypothetical protein
LGLVDTVDPSKPCPIITPTTTVKLLSKTYLNPLVQSFKNNPYSLGDLSNVSIESVQEMQVLDFSVNEGGAFPVITLLCTLAQDKY